VTTNIAGVATLFSAAGRGTLAIGSQNSTQPLTANAGADFVTRSPMFQLTSNRTANPGGAQLTYRWRFIPVFGQFAEIQNANTASPTVVLPDYSSAAGNYTFELTVTDAQGNTSTDTVLVTYDPPAPRSTSSNP
jgi:hypothetical protein